MGGISGFISMDGLCRSNDMEGFGEARGMRSLGVGGSTAWLALLFLAALKVLVIQ